MSREQTKEIAEKLVAFCKAHNDEGSLNTLYADDVVSVEAEPMSGSDTAEIHGLEGLRGKHAWWNNTMEMHSSSVDGPYMHGDDRFGVIFEMDVTNKETGERMEAKELGVYTVKDGKVVREEFFYTM